MNQKGFVHIVFLAALPFLLGSFLLLYFWVGTLQLESKIRFLCRQEQIAAQERSRGYLEQLFKKNDLARKLKIRHDVTEAALAAAIASQNWEAVEPLREKLALINFQREALDLTQKVLIQAANLDLKMSGLKLYQMVSHESQSQKTLLAIFLDIQIRALNPRIPLLAVVPAYPDIAPEYRTQDRFSERQALEQSWQYRVRVISPLNQFLKGEANFKKESRITLAGEDEKWHIENQTAKSWSKL